MRKFTTVFSVVLLFVGVALTLGWPYLKMGFASSANYTERDKREYDYYTPELIKKMPRISDNYEFSYSNISGPQAYVFSVHFQGARDSIKIQNYLKTEGYELQKTCDVEAECWRSHKTNDVISIAKFLSSNEIFVDLYRSSYNEPLAYDE
ncbi:hypothetical protein HH682_10590 [Rosenbergiella sp. S61]|uniref:SPOR domain-containing protein n=1 Tax=Rosenbergiella gaditana TaxID=2726987 RepID=A0ABS5SXX8_9GAMM|nr:hypothetical protein [Rosenbergiella gaditana]